jgi:hypothetical protein
MCANLLKRWIVFLLAVVITQAVQASPVYWVVNCNLGGCPAAPQHWMPTASERAALTNDVFTNYFGARGVWVPGNADWQPYINVISSNDHGSIIGTVNGAYNVFTSFLFKGGALVCCTLDDFRPFLRGINNLDDVVGGGWWGAPFVVGDLAVPNDLAGYYPQDWYYPDPRMGGVLMLQGLHFGFVYTAVDDNRNVWGSILDNPSDPDYSRYPFYLSTEPIITPEPSSAQLFFLGMLFLSGCAGVRSRIRALARRSFAKS